ncbi:MAG: hypothetical protein LC796_13730 [Acidobacteria bacterium]|nr:hypothetical protein [Acidobacteriota bacterium]MCA1612165.1 hypothetical protein [Acidobacteriota bacterium]
MKIDRGLWFFWALALTGSALASPLPVKKTTLVTIPATFTVDAPPAKVWEAITSVEGFGTLTGFRAIGVAKSFAKIGDAVPAQVWSDSGRLVVTELVPGKELRVTWEPAKGHYLCSKRIVLSAAGAGTGVEYWDRYTDDQPNADENARQVAAETEKQITAFRALAAK